ncbi:hypothetical protein [Pontibacter ruber]|uniref:Uncharacterized protein n=1 Tax=Pontibacter ruber TaxID=1343895 RepID=A0ABW5D164_9BACT|nr:hypothetical protein [Pontibacter ruber]
MQRYPVWCVFKIQAYLHPGFSVKGKHPFLSSAVLPACDSHLYQGLSINSKVPDMKQKDNAHIKKGDKDQLGEKGPQQELSKNPAPRDADHESDTTPPDHEVYVDLEPDELHPDEEPLDVNEEDEK